MKEELLVGFIGNPNCGKTTLFNAYTGANLKVANWPGVTVEKKEGKIKYHEYTLRLVDLPGIYSLSSYTMEEKLTREFILNLGPDVIINIVDASSLERNLYLTLQLLELGKPVILALNMMDIVEERGMSIDLKELSEMLHIPVVPVSARKRTGLNNLMNIVVHESSEGRNHNYDYDKKNVNIGYIHMHKREYLPDNPVVYSNHIEEKINEISRLLYEKYPEIRNARWYALKILEMDESILSQYPICIGEYDWVNYEEDIISQKYDYIEKIIGKVLINKDNKAKITDKADRLLTHRYLGLPVFFAVMALVFLFTFKIGDIVKIVFEMGLEQFSKCVLYLLHSLGAGKFVTSLIVDGIISGVGGILTFLPNIFILFLALGYLEDSGYMSRVAYVMDGIMGKLGLSGRAFIPMLLGFGCSVPAIMASRTLEQMEDRKRTILVTPFMSCSARLPVYILFSKMFFGRNAIIAAYSMYLIGIATAILVVYVMNKNMIRKENNSLLIELPEYKIPNERTIFIYVWDKVKEYLTKAGTTIFAASVILWFILNLGPQGMATDMSQSYGAMIGKAAAPILAPAGLGMWQIVVALISGIAAKEVIVSSFSVLFHINNITAKAGMESLADVLSGYGFGALNAYSLMVFCLLYIPCVATIGVIQRELRSVKWTIFMIIFQLTTAMLVSTLIYQIGSLFL